MYHLTYSYMPPHEMIRTRLITNKSKVYVLSKMLQHVFETKSVIVEKELKLINKEEEFLTTAEIESQLSLKMHFQTCKSGVLIYSNIIKPEMTLYVRCADDNKTFKNIETLHSLRQSNINVFRAYYEKEIIKSVEI